MIIPAPGRSSVSASMLNYPIRKLAPKDKRMSHFSQKAAHGINFAFTSNGRIALKRERGIMSTVNSVKGSRKFPARTRGLLMVWKEIGKGMEA